MVIQVPEQIYALKQLMLLKDTQVKANILKQLHKEEEFNVTK